MVGPLPCGVVRRCPTLPHPVECSTIGAVGLSFRVRDGTGRFPHAMTTVTLSPPVSALGGGGLGESLSWCPCDEQQYLIIRAGVRVFRTRVGCGWSRAPGPVFLVSPGQRALAGLLLGNHIVNAGMQCTGGVWGAFEGCPGTRYGYCV